MATANSNHGLVLGSSAFPVSNVLMRKLLSLVQSCFRFHCSTAKLERGLSIFQLNVSASPRCQAEESARAPLGDEGNLRLNTSVKHFQPTGTTVAFLEFKPVEPIQPALALAGSSEATGSFRQLSAFLCSLTKDYQKLTRTGLAASIVS
jgi:hypothetical protein